MINTSNNFKSTPLLLYHCFLLLFQSKEILSSFFFCIFLFFCFFHSLRNHLELIVYGKEWEFCY